MQPYYNDILSTDYPINPQPQTGGVKHKKKETSSKSQPKEKLSDQEQINRVLNDKKGLYLTKITRENIKNISFRTPMILVAKSTDNPKKYETQNIYFIRYDKELEGIWYSFIDPWQISTMTQLYSYISKNNKSMWQMYYKCQEKFTPLGLINYDETYILKI